MLERPCPVLPPVPVGRVPAPKYTSVKSISTFHGPEATSAEPGGGESTGSGAGSQASCPVSRQGLHVPGCKSGKTGRQDGRRGWWGAGLVWRGA